MISPRFLTPLVSILFLCSCSEEEKIIPIEENTISAEAVQTVPKIPILNFGTFHLGYTTDQHTTEFDQHNKKNQAEAHEIAAMLAEFKPTVILVETTPTYDETLQADYKEYLANPEMFFENPTEIELLAFELGRLSGTERIYGIDHKMGYNYMIGSEIENSIDSVWYNKYYSNPMQFSPEIDVNKDSLNLKEKLILTNNDVYLDFLITVNADMLTYAGTENQFEGADEAAKYYQRNLRMYSNLHRIDLKADDRVFILMGASHTAFFRDFISRSPQYKMVETGKYLK